MYSFGFLVLWKEKIRRMRSARWLRREARESVVLMTSPPSPPSPSPPSSSVAVVVVVGSFVSPDIIMFIYFPLFLYFSIFGYFFVKTQKRKMKFWNCILFGYSFFFEHCSDKYYLYFFLQTSLLVSKQTVLILLQF